MLTRIAGLLSMMFMGTVAEILAEFTYLESTEGVLHTTLIVDQYFYDNTETDTKFWTRLYNPPISGSGPDLTPGPLFYLRRGDNVTVTLQNDLGPEGSVSSTLNSFHYPNTTNLHTHGLHITAESPQDNIFLSISPGESYTYRYEIPEDHAGGTFWYHAHHHGSTACQVGGGLLGVIIIADDASEVPAEYLDMEEMVLLISHVPIWDLASIYLSETGDNLFTHADNVIVNGASFFLVNGQYEPTATITKGKWTRLRIVYSALLDSLQLRMTTTTSAPDCEWHLLAKDGIYVAEAPRPLGTTMYFAPGNRVDVVVRCGSTGSFTLGSDTDTILLTVDVEANSGADDEALPRFNPYRPDYLADVYTATSATEYSINFQPAGGGGPGGGGGGAGCAINGQAWDGSTPLSTMETGSIQKWQAVGTDKHPFHLHVNSFQLQGVTDANGFFVEGDWHDVIFPPAGVSVQGHFFAVDTFRTKSILHCHFLPHEDLGCMGYIEHTGTQGATTGLAGNSMSLTGTSTSITDDVSIVDDGTNDDGNDGDDDNDTNGVNSVPVYVWGIVGAVCAIIILGMAFALYKFVGGGAAAVSVKPVSSVELP